MRTFPLIYPIAGWFIGCLSAFLFHNSVHFLWPFLLGVCICTTMLLLAKVYKPKLMRLITIITLSVFLGASYFFLNDYRHIEINENAESYIVQVLESKELGLDNQQLKVKVLKAEHQGEFEKINFDL